jgi:capsular polysaccharide biosynthesis protein
VRKVLDRLMARQHRLMDSLGPEPAVIPRAPALTLSAEAVQARLAVEQAAVAKAFEALAAGNLNTARGVLEPLAESALDTRTLTTLSRIYSAQGYHELALNRLKQAEAIDPADAKVIHFMAELLKQLGNRVEELHYRRRAAFTTRDAPIATFVRLISAAVMAAPRNRPPPLGEVCVALERVKTAVDVAPELRIEAARSVFGIRSLTRDAMSLYGQAEPLAAGEREVLASQSQVKDWCAAQSAPLHRLHDFGAAGMRPMMAELSDAIVVPAAHWLPIMGDGNTVLSDVAASRLPLRSDNPRSPVLLVSDRQALLRLPNHMPEIEEPVLLLGGSGSGSYYENVVEYIGALAIPETLGLGADLKILVNNDLAPHQLALFELLGVSKDRLLRWDPAMPFRVKRLWAPTRLTRAHSWFDPLLPHWYRQRFAALTSSERPRRKLYLSRSAATRRRVGNEAEVIGTLEPLGYECVHAESLSVREQVALFSQASHIVGSSGGALTNMLFSPAGTRVTVLVSRQLIQGGSEVAFDSLARVCGHEVHVEPCEAARLAPNERPIDADIAVDCAKLAQSLS